MTRFPFRFKINKNFTFQRKKIHFCIINFNCRAEGSNILLDPTQVCKKTQKLPNKILEICKQHSRNKTSNEKTIMKNIVSGISLGFRECENQFRHRKWNCTSQRRSMKKILMKGVCVCVRWC